MEKILITGGAGFIGCNLSDYFIRKGYKIIIYDNLSRSSSEKNLRWLKENKRRFNFVKGDVRDFELIKKYVKNVDAIFHTAAQVAVTTSVINPREDFEINALGTLNILEAIRKSKNKPILIFTSTNKVYGKMEEVKIRSLKARYEYRDLKFGVNEERLLDFYSPYGCSKGCADEYVKDYARIYELPAVVFRMSCIYGERQFGNEDQGWVAHFIISSVLNKVITIYGDGKQIRDVLYIGDLVSLFEMTLNKINKLKGKVYNIGGGIDNTISLIELVSFLEERLNKKIELRYSSWRPGDQRVYISDIRKARKEIGWYPKVDVHTGINQLLNWVIDNWKE